MINAEGCQVNIEHAGPCHIDAKSDAVWYDKEPHIPVTMERQKRKWCKMKLSFSNKTIIPNALVNKGNLKDTNNEKSKKLNSFFYITLSF